MAGPRPCPRSAALRAATSKRRERRALSSRPSARIATATAATGGGSSRICARRRASRRGRCTRWRSLWRSPASTAPEAAELCDWLSLRLTPRRRAAICAPGQGHEPLRPVLGRGRTVGLLAPDHVDRRGARQSRRRARPGGRRSSLARPGDDCCLAAIDALEAAPPRTRSRSPYGSSTPCTTVPTLRRDCWRVSPSSSRTTAGCASSGGHPDDPCARSISLPSPVGLRGPSSTKPRSRLISSGSPPARARTAAGRSTSPAYSPAAALEWRGYATVHALTVLRRQRVTRLKRRCRPPSTSAESSYRSSRALRKRGHGHVQVSDDPGSAPSSPVTGSSRCWAGAV